MPRRIWNGTGVVQDDEAYFTTHDGTIRGRPYVWARASAALAKANRFAARKDRGRWQRDRELILMATVGNDEWLARRGGELVASIARDVAACMVLDNGEVVNGYGRVLPLGQ